LAGHRVERTGGLVGQQQPAVADEGARDRHPLTFAAGEVVGEMCRTVGKAELAQKLPRGGVGGPAADPVQPQGSATFSVAVRPGRRLKSWKTKPMNRRRSAAFSSRDIPASGRPATRTSPSVGVWRVPAMASSVLLPDPLGPITATISPLRTVRS